MKEHGNKGRKQSKETIEKRRASLKGKKASEEARLNMSLAKKGKSGTKWSDEQRRKYKLTRTGKGPSQATKNKISVKMKGRRLTEEHKRNTSVGMKRMIENLPNEQRRKRVENWIKTGRTQFDSPVSNEEKQLGDFLTSKSIQYESQYYIRPYFIDFYVPESNMIIEYFGCFWHQCEKCQFNQGHSGYTAEKIREYDKQKISYLKSKGYKVRIVWGHDLHKYKESNR